MSFNFKKLKIPDVVVIEPESFNDERGYFFENYNALIFNGFWFCMQIIATSQKP